MTHRYHLMKKKVGVEGPPIPFSKILNKSHGNPFLLSKIWGALNPHFFLHQMVPMGHRNNTLGLFLPNNFFHIDSPNIQQCKS